MARAGHLPEKRVDRLRVDSESASKVGAQIARDRAFTLDELDSRSLVASMTTFVDAEGFDAGQLRISQNQLFSKPAVRAASQSISAKTACIFRTYGIV